LRQVAAQEHDAVGVVDHAVGGSPRQRQYLLSRRLEWGKTAQERRAAKHRRSP
jgi:hypothetical protein